MVKEAVAESAAIWRGKFLAIMADNDGSLIWYPCTISGTVSTRCSVGPFGMTAKDGSSIAFSLQVASPYPPCQAEKDVVKEAVAESAAI